MVDFFVVNRTDETDVTEVIGVASSREKAKTIISIDRNIKDRLIYQEAIPQEDFEYIILPFKLDKWAG